ncbi:hypothetical protein A5634_06080 [Mycobacterium asiaticum]|uniref:HTH araC/xylS-type domain-containing protein n=1 Tax=Mycobacterium asiaticum TaxID=1790 RepID=A0A1A3NRY0_MYCAS|nr:helix-turn-helix transcriptional regulator [Mycobacterium asiaticum]OBK23082.1 hypothetical protein A5634_06080 [Mycobacterium asiaticum]
MFKVLLDTKDLGEAEAVLSANFAKIRIKKTSGDTSSMIRMERATVGSIAVNTANYGLDFSYEMEPPAKIVICRVLSGALEERFNGLSTAVFNPGEVGVIGAPQGVPCAGHVQQGHYEQLIIQPSLLTRRAPGPGGGDEPVRLTGSVPVSPEAARQLFDVVGYFGRVAANRYAYESPLITAGLERYVASTLLATLPNSAREATHNRHDGDDAPVLLRRAVTYIDDNAHDDISLGDIASAVYVTPRALQYMFRKHRDSTPMEYLRRVRLHYAHRDLVTADRATTTVSAVARRWGFTHMGRFSVYYREHYGQSPHVTLREG